MTTYRFIKTGQEWYIDLPVFIEQGGNMGDLQMVDGADDMLNIMAGADKAVWLQLSKDPFNGADRLELLEKCDPIIGGGYYLMKKFEGSDINKTMWLCSVTEFVFGDLPQQIFVSKIDV